MAMDVAKELANDKKPDTSFLKAKYTKKRSEVKAPYGQTAEVENEKKPQPEVVEKVVKKVAGATKSKTTSSSNKTNRTLSIPEESKFVKKYGHQYFAYYYLINAVAKDNKISLSQPDLAEVLAVEKASVRKILIEMDAKGMIKKTREADSKTKIPAQYELLCKI